VVSLTLLDPDGNEVERQERRITAEDRSPSFRFRFRPLKSGILFYKLKAKFKESNVEEITDANNHRTVVVDRGGGPYHVLYITGRPNWEFKFLRRALSTDEQVRFVGLIRIAKREPKFAWRGRRGNSNNPLFRGFDKTQSEDAEKFDQPVLIRLGTEDAKELQDGFPKTAEELFAYHALIIDDLEAKFFTHDQQRLIQQFVSERGGGLLMLGGQESFQAGGYAQTPLAEALPVYLDRAGKLASDTPRRLKLSREGWLEPWLRLRSDETSERDRLQRMPGFRVLNAVRSEKPGARIVLEAVGPEGRFPALVTQSYGSGQSAALLIGDVWRWGIGNPNDRKDRGKFWRQMMRWLVANVPGRVTVHSEPAADHGAGVFRLRVTVRDVAYLPMDNAMVKVRVTNPKGKPVELTARPVEGRSGLYEAMYLSQDSGGYLAEATAIAGTQQPIGTAATGWSIDAETEEHRTVHADRSLLQRIASATGGQMVEIDDLDDLPETLAHIEVPVEEPTITSLWHTPLVFFFAIALLLGEWTLRRWRGLP
jgi:uncharacterized membrane protein